MALRELPGRIGDAARNCGLALVKAVHRTLGWMLPPQALSRTLPGVPARVHVDDLMLASPRATDVAHYAGVGREAVGLLADAVSAEGRDLARVHSCLELPCGYGRVTRWLCRSVPPARVTVSDVDRQAVRFCAREFGVRPLVAPPDPRRLRLAPLHDLVFAGSLFTHLPPADGAALLDALAAALVPGGVLVLTTQGETCLEHLGWYGNAFAAAEPAYRTAIARSGIGFVAYPGQRAWGITIETEAYVRGLVRERHGGALSVVRCMARGWDGHQDVYVLRRAR